MCVRLIYGAARHEQSAHVALPEQLIHRQFACQLRHTLHRNVTQQLKSAIHAGHSTLHDVCAFTGRMLPTKLASACMHMPLTEGSFCHNVSTCQSQSVMTRKLA